MVSRPFGFPLKLIKNGSPKKQDAQQMPTGKLAPLESFLAGKSSDRLSRFCGVTSKPQGLVSMLDVEEA